MAYNYCSLGFLRGSLSTWLQLLSVCGWRSKGEASHDEGKKPKASQWERRIGKTHRKGAASRGQGKWQVHSSRGYSTPPKDGGKAGLFSARSATGLARVKGKRKCPGRQDRALYCPSLCAHYQHTLSTATTGHRKQCLP